MKKCLSNNLQPVHNTNIKETYYVRSNGFKFKICYKHLSYPPSQYATHTEEPAMDVPWALAVIKKIKSDNRC